MNQRKRSPLWNWRTETPWLRQSLITERLEVRREKWLSHPHHNQRWAMKLIRGYKLTGWEHEEEPTNLIPRLRRPKPPELELTESVVHTYHRMCYTHNVPWPDGCSSFNVVNETGDIIFPCVSARYNPKDEEED